NFVPADAPAIHAEQPVRFRALAQGRHAALRMSYGQVSLLREHDVVVKLQRQPFVELDAFVVECHALRRAVVRANDGRVAATGPAAQVAFVENCDIGDATLGQVIGDGETVHAGADDDDVVGRLQVM